MSEEIEGLDEAESELEAASPEASDSAPKVAKPRGRFLGLLGFLFGIAGLGIAGYLYYLLVYADPQAAVDARLQSVESSVSSGARELEEIDRRQREALDRFAETQRQERDASAEQLLEAVNQLATQAPPSRREWKVAEVAYLLRIANHRLLMERDVDGALTLLQGADAILVELDDFSLFQVRARLSDEIVSLENVESSDVQGLFLRLEAVKTELGRHRLKLPKFEAPEPTGAEEAGFWSALVTQLGSYMRFRRFEGESVKPLLAPDQAVYLELNLRLMLERAQLAALRREQLIYEQSLQTAADWIASYLEGEDAGIQRAVEELDAMSTIRLDQSLPDISGSLAALKSMGEA
jgi:uroporphyrin-3 C-methyltransferase